MIRGAVLGPISMIKSALVPLIVFLLFLTTSHTHKHYSADCAADSSRMRTINDGELGSIGDIKRLIVILDYYLHHLGPLIIICFILQIKRIPWANFPSVNKIFH